MSVSETLSYKSYGCVYCMTGKEKAVARSIEVSNSGVRATPVRQIKRNTFGGHTTLNEQIVFPGYVFLEVEHDSDSLCFLPRENIKELLTTPNSSWKLSGNDERFAKWLFSLNGLITLSKAFMEGERVRIASGPLKDLEGCITRIDKRNRSGQVMIMFNNRTVKVWLGYEMIEKEQRLT